jgi:hemerythrin-like domain-containing protein
VKENRMSAAFKPLAANFDHPLEMLEACHGRIRAQCATLRQLAQHLPRNGCDAQAQQAASNVMRYFDSAARHHQEDEEEDLFPHLIASAKVEERDRAAQLIGRLQREHHDLERMWLRIREPLESIAHGEEAPLDAADIEHFCSVYDEHMALEEQNLMPLAERVLDQVALVALGRSMARRRGVKF